jgi:hypothetical protein
MDRLASHHRVTQAQELVGFGEQSAIRKRLCGDPRRRNFVEPPRNIVTNSGLVLIRDCGG